MFGFVIFGYSLMLLCFKVSQKSLFEEQMGLLNQQFEQSTIDGRTNHRKASLKKKRKSLFTKLSQCTLYFKLQNTC